MVLFIGQAGPELLAECRTLNGCETGQAKLTQGYQLPAKFVIHTVGPIWQGGDHQEAELLQSCYRSSLELALAHPIQTLAFPAISCGVYGYPINQAVQIALQTTLDVLQKQNQIQVVIFACLVIPCIRPILGQPRTLGSISVKGSDFHQPRTKL